MRAVWSFWSKPFKERQKSMWASEQHHLFSWALSLERARLLFPETVLVTDSDGARLLVDSLRLPFSAVSTELDALHSRDARWWMLGKLYAYRAQVRPFIHIDSDVFLWKPLPPRMTTAPVLAQNPEYFRLGASYYRPERFEKALGRDAWLPPEWRWYRSLGRIQHGYCCGILGGQATDFIRHYADQAIRILECDANQPGLRRLAEVDTHTVSVEQYFLSACIAYHRHTPGSSFPDVAIECLFADLDDAFDEARAEAHGFTHLLAGSKRNPVIASDLERAVREDYPELYERCVAAANTAPFPLAAASGERASPPRLALAAAPSTA